MKNVEIVQSRYKRYISLTKLIPEFLQKLDDELISFNPAVEISALKEEEQKTTIRSNGLCSGCSVFITGTAD